MMGAFYLFILQSVDSGHTVFSKLMFKLYEHLKKSVSQSHKPFMFCLFLKKKHFFSLVQKPHQTMCLVSQYLDPKLRMKDVLIRNRAPKVQFLSLEHPNLRRFAIQKIWMKIFLKLSEIIKENFMEVH
eukprot:gnl/Chilomastix_cuspidata/6571.p2 GENE.gnl/Chilomastix_cuspidata/6571~~gnl/Chilomastix_cuspidata/6571.p2  ORF type:complete len:128 (+),score=15.46 gnl/Chilomastix_cuspidata/6571:1704-2087(+)